MTVPLPDPGKARRTGPILWRVVPGEEPLVDALAKLRCESPGDVLGLEPLRAEGHAFRGRFLHDGRSYFVKGRTTRATGRMLRSLFRDAPERVEWRKTWWVRERGIPASEPVAVGEIRRLGMLREGFFVCRWLAGASPFTEFLAERERALPPVEFEGLRRRLIRDLGFLFGAFHAAGAWHRQFHGQNVLVAADGQGPPRLIALDFNHLTVRGRLDPEDRAFNFYQLAWYLGDPARRWGHGLPDLALFLDGYYRAAPDSAPSFDALLRWLASFLPREPLARKPRREDLPPVPPMGGRV